MVGYVCRSMSTCTCNHKWGKLEKMMTRPDVHPWVEEHLCSMMCEGLVSKNKKNDSEGPRSAPPTKSYEDQGSTLRQSTLNHRKSKLHIRIVTKCGCIGFLDASFQCGTYG